MQLLTECTTAVHLGFGRFRHFQRALREGRIPQPDFTFSDGPRWSEALLERWIAGSVGDRSTEAESRALIEALRTKGWRRQDTPAHEAIEPRRRRSGG